MSKKGSEKMIVFKIDVLKALKEKGYNTRYLRNNKLLSENTMRDIRHKNTVGTIKSLNVICSLLNCQPNYIIKYVKEETKE